MPLDFEALSTHAPFYKSALSDPLKYDLIFNSPGTLINSIAAATYTIDNICLEFDMVTQTALQDKLRASILE